jgi:hypothetical protein
MKLYCGAFSINYLRDERALVLLLNHIEKFKVFSALIL